MEPDAAGIYAEIVKELVHRKPEISDYARSAYILSPCLPNNVVAAVPDYIENPWLRYVLGYSHPPVLLNPNYAYELSRQDLMAVLYHEALHRAQMDESDEAGLRNIVEKYVRFQDEHHRELFYSLRGILNMFPNLRRVLMEGEAQYLTRKAFPDMNRALLPYTEEEVPYRRLIENARPDRYAETLLEFLLTNTYLEFCGSCPN